MLQEILIVIIFAITLFTISYKISSTILKTKENKQRQLQLLEEQNKLLREQLNRDK